MLVLSIVLALTNIVTLAVLRQRRQEPDPCEPCDVEIHQAFDVQRPSGVTGPTRRIISVEILNPIELAGTRGRMVGIAGSIAPNLTRRIVYDRTLKALREQLREEQVVADVRLHTLRPVANATPGHLHYDDEVEMVDLREAPGDQPPV